MFTICTNQSHLPKKGAAKACNWYQRWLWRTWISFWIPIVKSGLPFHAFRCCWIFSTETISNVVFQIFSNRIFRKRFVITGKQQLPPWSSVETNSRLFYSCIAPLYDCLTNLALFYQPIRSKFKAARGLVPPTCVLFRCDWLMRLSAFIAIDRFTLVGLVS